MLLRFHSDRGGECKLLKWRYVDYIQKRKEVFVG